MWKVCGTLGRFSDSNSARAVINFLMLLAWRLFCISVQHPKTKPKLSKKQFLSTQSKKLIYKLFWASCYLQTWKLSPYRSSCPFDVFLLGVNRRWSYGNDDITGERPLASLRRDMQITSTLNLTKFSSSEDEVMWKRASRSAKMFFAFPPSSPNRRSRRIADKHSIALSLP